MCGIIGRWNTEKPVDKEVFNRMRDSLRHRGPDGFGTWLHNSGKIALGHRRLSFIDLSPAGTQPMSNEDKSVWVTANGEIYNYIELREELKAKGHTFRSGTDSEIIVHAWEEWGADMLPKFNGMFAFGLWDEQKHTMLIARDRFGIKPLYYYLKNGELIFASEIKAIIEDREIARTIDIKSVCDYFYYRYVPSPASIFKNINKLEPGHYAIIQTPDNIRIHPYYLPATGNNKLKNRQAKATTDELLKSSVSMHIRSEVPVGSFLSGGYDSSVMVKYFSQFAEGFNTFSAGFSDWDKSEHQYAALVSAVYNTRHHNLMIDSSNYDILPELMYYYDEPIADISILPTFLISRLAAQYNKTVLSGEGADEIFAGYTWHRPFLWNISKKQLSEAKKYGWEIPYNNYDVESYSRAMEMGLFGKTELKQMLDPSLHNYIPDDEAWFYRSYFNVAEPIPKRFQLLDISTFMGELVLTKIDRASMAHSLEVRVPFLDHRLVDFMLSLNTDVYFSLKKQKKLLFELLKKDLPKIILQRKKQGFTGPDSFYHNMAFYATILSDSSLVRNKIINRQYVEKLIASEDYWRLWKICILELWYKKWVE